MFLQEEFDDEDDWNPSKAAGVCLMLLATCCENAIVPYVLPFVKDNIKNSDWRYRDAALMAFGKHSFSMLLEKSIKCVQHKKHSVL